MSRIAVFPGSFDPITLGHKDIIERALPLFDKIIIAVGNNSKKQYLFSLEKRMEWLNAIFKQYKNVEVNHYDSLTVDFCKKSNAKFIIRGIRSSADFEYEKTIAQLNNSMSGDIETLFFLSKPEFSHISSTIVREIYIHKGDISKFVPKEITLVHS